MHKNIIDYYNTSFYKKENKIPIKYYEDIYEKVLTIFKKYTKETQYTIVSVDGTYNNTNYNNEKN